MPVVCSFLFGPAGAWGAAIGNLIGDFFGGIGPGDFFGFAANFLYGFLPYRVWRMLSPTQDPLPRSLPQWAAFVAVVALAAAACAVVVGWGLNGLGFVPFAVLANIVFFNNFLMAVAVAAPAVGDLPAREARWTALRRRRQDAAAPRSVLLGRTRCRQYWVRSAASSSATSFRPAASRSRRLRPIRRGRVRAGRRRRGPFIALIIVGLLLL